MRTRTRLEAMAAAEVLNQNTYHEIRVLGLDPGVLKRLERREEEQIVKLERRIMGTDGTRVDLARLVDAGADRQILLRFLLLAATWDSNWLRTGMRKRIAWLRSLAQRLRTLAELGEELARDPFISLEVCEHFFVPYPGGPPLRRPKESPFAPFSLMRTYSTILRSQARAIGMLLRRFSLKDSKMGVIGVLFYVRKATGRYYYAELARLLTDAFEAAGKREEVSANLLARIRSRKVRPLDLWS